MTLSEVKNKITGTTAALVVTGDSEYKELELAKKILGKNVDVEITGSEDSETQVQKAIVKLSKGQISVKEYVKTILHEGGHLVDAGKGKFVETILNGMSDETYKEMWETLEPKYKEEIMQSNMLKREMNNNPGLTSEEAYERIKKKYLDEEIAVEYFGTMFKNSKEFMNDIKAYTSKGLKGLKEKFRLFFRGKAKPDNYKELLEMFDKGIKEADERAVKRLEEEREKRIKEIEESLPTDEEDVKYRKKGENYAKTNDFRELQEANRRMAINEIEAFHRGDKIVDERIRNRLSRILREQLGSSSSMFGYDDVVLTNPINNTNIKIYKNVNAYEFHDIFELVKNYLYNGDLVDIHDVQSSEWSTGYEDCTCYLMENGLSGFAITKNGDLISVFNLGWKGFLKTIKNYIRTEGAKTLDCYNSKTQPLPQMYEKILGFKTASILDFNYDILLESKGKKYADYFVEIYGESPVHFMVLTDENIKMKTFDKDQYDEAYDYQQEIANPTLDDDIRYRITKSDSEGNKLSPKQQEYFNDSVVRDDNGNLLVVYHGSRNEFTIFDRNKAGESNTEAKIGFWFTTSEKGAKSFSNSVWYGDNDEALAYKGYLNIKNPKIYEETKFDKEYVDSLHKEKRELEKQLDGDNYTKTLYNLAEKHQYPVWNVWKILGKIEKIDGLDNRLDALQETNLPNEIKELEIKDFKIRARLKELDDLIAETFFNDAYENFRTDFYKFLGANAEDANIAGSGKALWRNGEFVNMKEAIENYRNHIIEQGYDGIIIKDTKYDSGRGV